MKRSQVILATTLCLLMVGLTACGKKGAPKPPTTAERFASSTAE